MHKIRETWLFGEPGENTRYSPVGRRVGPRTAIEGAET